MSRLWSRSVIAKLHAAVNSSAPLLLLGELVNEFQDSGIPNSDETQMLRSFNTHIQSPFSPLVESPSFYEIVREIESLACRCSEHGQDEMACTSKGDWHGSTDKEKEEIARRWDVYEREGLGYVLIACGNLVLQMPFKVYDAIPGIQHGGTWVIHAFVSLGDLEKCPENYALSMDSFPVIWIPTRQRL